MNTYLLCEDTKSGLSFWRFIVQAMNPGCVVEGKGGISNLRRMVSLIADSEDRYFVVVDYVFDNPSVLREISAITRIAKAKSNVTLIKIHSFEYILLSFALLDKWVFAERDELKEQRKPLLELKDVFVQMIGDGTDSGMLGEGSAAGTYLEEHGYNTEQALSRLLFGITRNTGFETDKSKLGDCFTVDCCKWENRASDDICGLDEAGITSVEKARLIVKYSVLSSIPELEGLLHD